MHSLRAGRGHSSVRAGLPIDGFLPLFRAARSLLTAILRSDLLDQLFERGNIPLGMVVNTSIWLSRDWIFGEWLMPPWL